MALKPSLHREEYIQRKKTTRNIRVAVFVFVVLTLVSLSSFVAHRHNIRIQKVQLTGGVLVTTDDVQKVVDSVLSGKYFFIYPKNNSFIYPHDELVTELKRNLQRIDSVSVNVENFHSLTVDITERKPSALWCDNSNPDMEKCYFMDDTSTVFADAPVFSGDAYFKYYGPLSTTTPDGTTLGSRYMASSTEFAEISTFVSDVLGAGLRPQYLLQKGGGEYSLVVYNGGQIYFDTREPLSQVTQNLQILLKSDAYRKAVSATSTLDYIDLRFGNKVYYKLK